MKPLKLDFLLKGAVDGVHQKDVCTGNLTMKHTVEFSHVFTQDF